MLACLFSKSRKQHRSVVYKISCEWACLSILTAARPRSFLLTAQVFFNLFFSVREEVSETNVRSLYQLSTK